MQEMIETANKYVQNNKLTRAIELFTSIEKQEDFATLSVKNKITFYDTWGAACFKLGQKNVDQHIKLYTESLDAYTKEQACLSENHNSVIEVKQKIAKILLKRAWVYKDECLKKKNTENEEAVQKLEKDIERATQLIPDNEEDDLYLELLDVKRCLCGLKADNAYDQKQYELATVYYKQAIDILDKFITTAEKNHKQNQRYIGDLSVLADCLHNSGECYKNLNQLYQGLLYFLMAKSSYEKLITLDSKNKKDYKKSLTLTEKCLQDLPPLGEQDQQMISSLVDNNNKKDNSRKRKFQVIGGLEIYTEDELMEMDEKELENLRTKWMKLEAEKTSELNSLKNALLEAIHERDQIISAFSTTISH